MEYPLIWNIPYEKGAVYAIVCNKKWKSYVGSTNCLRKRIKRHLESLNSGSHSAKDMQEDFNKFGVDSFKVEILEELDDENLLLEREHGWVQFGENLYNCGAYLNDLPEFDEEFKQRFWSKIKVGDVNECWPWIAKSVAPEGYGRIKYKKRMYTSHRVAYKLLTGQDCGKLIAAHQCDNPSCCNPNHLKFGSCRANARDRVNKERFTKLNWEIVNWIRDQYRRNKNISGVFLQNEIERLFKIRVANPTVNKIISNSTWTDVNYKDFVKFYKNRRAIPAAFISRNRGQ